MKIKKISSDRWNTHWETEDGRKFKLERYPTSQHAAFQQIELYRSYLKGTHVGEEVELNDNDSWARAIIERAIKRQTI
jgi:hypothetical protein